MSLASMKEDSKGDQEVYQKTGSTNQDVDLIEYSCEFCEFKASDPVDIELHRYKKHKYVE